MGLAEQRILITGASGALGKQLVFELVRDGIKPICHVRATSDTALIDSYGLEKRVLDFTVDKDCSPLVEGVDSVIHTAAWVNFRQDRMTQFTALNTFGAVSLFKAAQKAGVKRFVHVSSVAAVGAVDRGAIARRDPSAEPLLVNENWEFNLRNLRIHYIMTKRAAEDELLKLAENGPTELVIVNPSIVVAPSRTGDDRAKARKRFKRILMPSVPNRFNLVDIRDVVPAILTALEKGRHKERYILAGDNIEADDFILAVSINLGVAPHLIAVPRWMVRWASGFSRLAARLSRKGKVSFYPDIVRLIDYDWVYSSMKARRELSFKPRSIHYTLNDLLSNNMVGTYQKPAP